MAPDLFEFLLVDFRPQSDLMFWDQLTRSITAAKRDNRKICIVVGCAENTERILLQSGKNTTRSITDELDLPLDLSGEIEVALREEKHQVASRLTDEGVAAVGMMAFDRGLVTWKDGDVVAKPGAVSHIWPASGVVPVMMSVVKDEAGRLIDIHPIRLCKELTHSVSTNRGDASYTSSSANKNSPDAPQQCQIAVLSHRPEVGRLVMPISGNDEVLNHLIKGGKISPLIKKGENRPNWSVIGPIF